LQSALLSGLLDYIYGTKITHFHRMTDLPSSSARQASPWAVAFTVLMTTVMSFLLVGPFIGAIIAYALYDGDIGFMDFLAEMADPVGKENLKMLLMLMQGSATLIGLAIIPPIVWQAMTRKRVFNLVKYPPVKPVHLLLVFGILLFFSGLNSVFIEWNVNVDLPDGAFEKWAREFEDRAMETTKYLTSFSNVGQYLVAVLVIAVFAGIGEELVFRGILQNELQRSFRNHHAAIWVAAIIFSVFHVQFYGLVPRILLGALFGYLYYWSGNLMVPIFAHFVNNFFAVSMIYFGMTELPGLETENPTSPPWYAVLISTAICGALIYYYRSILPKPALDDVTA
jgi:membrane protease YdiL (CAAX protease family)